MISVSHSQPQELAPPEVPPVTSNSVGLSGDIERTIPIEEMQRGRNLLVLIINFLGILGDAKGFSSAVLAWFEAMCIFYDRSG